jgi:hypothetical protein
MFSIREFFIVERIVYRRSEANAYPIVILSFDSLSLKVEFLILDINLRTKLPSQIHLPVNVGAS